MPLTERFNGNTSANLIVAQWFNDFYELFTGLMTDQIITFKTNVEMVPLGPNPAAPTLALTTGTQLGIGAYYYVLTFTSGDGESTIGTTATITTTSGSQAVSLSALPTGPTGTTGRNIYRTKVGGSANGPFYLVHSIADNTTTTYTDATTDAALPSTQPPTQNTYGGAIIFKNAAGQITGIMTGSGNLAISTINSDGGTITSDGSGDLTAKSLRINGGGTTGLYLNTGNASTPSWIQVGQVGFGIKDYNNVKLLELKANGALMIANTYGVTGTNTSISTSQSFINFDFAEVYPHDHAYPAGTVVCLGDHDHFVRCTHDNCPFACVISDKPAFLAGDIDEEKGDLPIALTGRVNVLTQETLTPRTLVCSDGFGGVRAMRKGEEGFSLGFTLNDTADGQVGVFIRPMYCKA